MLLTRRAFTCLAAAALTGCGAPNTSEVSRSGLNPGETPHIHALIRKYAQIYHMPESLIHRVIQRESDYNPRARNGSYYGLMQIAPGTAHTMGYRGTDSGLAGCRNQPEICRQISARGMDSFQWQPIQGRQWYAKGYYYEAKRRGLLQETGLRA